MQMQNTKGQQAHERLEGAGSHAYHIMQVVHRNLRHEEGRREGGQECQQGHPARDERHAGI